MKSRIRRMALRLFLFVFRAATARMARRFESALRDPQTAQARIRDQIAREALASTYGITHGMRAPADFRNHLPVTDYTTLEPWILRSRTEPRVLTSSRIRFFEKTSGSSGKSKEVPYTGPLLASFQRMFLLWVRDLTRAIPSLGSGKLYFLVSPRIGTQSDEKSSGLATDADYLGGFLKRLLAPFVLDISHAAGFKTAEEFRDAVATAWLECEALESLSLWNPSFLTAQLEWIEARRELLISRMKKPLSAARSAALRANPVAWQEVFPRLKLISCWTDAQAKPAAEKIARAFPSVLLQGKGLLATEAPITIPLHGISGRVPLLEEVYLEFIDEAGRMLELHEVLPHQTYELVISQRGGLYRYRLGDRVKVAGKHHNTPTFEFVGRGLQVSDLVGEKLHSDWVETCLNEVLGAPKGVRCVLPAREPRDYYICLVSEAPRDPLAEQLDQALARAHHYGLARKLGQLEGVRIVHHPRADQLLQGLFLRAGLRLGDIKTPAFTPRPADATLLGELGLKSSQSSPEPGARS